MTEHEYSAQDALERLLRLIERKDSRLADEVRASIDAGKDVEESDSPTGRRRKARRYRKSVRLSDQEALDAALKVLEAYFVEQSLFALSAHANFYEAALVVENGFWQKLRVHSSDEAERIGEPKEIAIDLRPETQITGSTDEIWILKPDTPDQLLSQQGNIRRLRVLLGFEG